MPIPVRNDCGEVGPTANQTPCSKATQHTRNKSARADFYLRPCVSRPLCCRRAVRPRRGSALTPARTMLCLRSQTGEFDSQAKCAQTTKSAERRASRAHGSSTIGQIRTRSEEENQRQHTLCRLRRTALSWRHLWATAARVVSVANPLRKKSNHGNRPQARTIAMSHPPSPSDTYGLSASLNKRNAPANRSQATLQSHPSQEMHYPNTTGTQEDIPHLSICRLLSWTRMWSPAGTNEGTSSGCGSKSGASGEFHRASSSAVLA